MYTNDGGVDHLHARVVSERQATTPALRQRTKRL